jgi:TolB protein
VPLLEAPPAGHPRAAAHLLGKHFPRNFCLEHEQDTRKSCAIVHPRATTLGFRRLLRQEWFDYVPKFVSYEWVRHGRRIRDHVVLLGALKRAMESKRDMLRSNELRVTTVASALMVAALFALLVVWGAKPAKAAFPGGNGLIVFASNMTTGTGVDNPTGDREIFTMAPEGGSITQLTNNTATDDIAPTWSKDGTQIAFQRSLSGGAYEIYTMDAMDADSDGNGDSQTNISNNAANDTAPAWSPTGHTLAFCSNRNSNTDVYTMDTDPATDDATRLTDDPAWDCEPDWRPHGTKIAFSSYRGDGGDSDIYVMSASGLNEVPRTKSPAHEYSPSWSPNGKKIAFVREPLDDSDLDIYVMNADGSRQRARTKDHNIANDEGPVFSPNGKKIVYARQANNTYEIYTMNSDGSNQTNLTSSSVGDWYPDWQPLP